mgnify:CR=1 FL=1
MTTATIRLFDHFVFQYCKDTLTADARPEDVARWYVDGFVFKNREYYKAIEARYKLPNDILKVHAKICELANMEYEEG